MLVQELQAVLNKFSAENESNTPDFVLAEFLTACLNALNGGISARDKWYGLSPEPGTNCGVRPAEAVFSFLGWLTTRPATYVFGASHDAGIAAQLAQHFVEWQGWQQPRHDYTDRIELTPDLPNNADGSTV